MFGAWLHGVLGGAGGGGPPVPPEPAPPAPDPPVPEPVPPPPPVPSLVDRWMTALFGESAVDHERRAVIYAARRKEYEEQKAAWEAHYHLAQTGTLQYLDYQRKKEEAQRLLTQEQKAHVREQKEHDRAGLEDEYERAKLQAGMHRLSLTNAPRPAPTVEAEVQRIKAIIERGERKEAALSELNRWKRERFAELDAAVVRGELTEGEAEDRKELIENLILKETRG